MIRVMLVDDQTLVRQGVRSLLALSSDIEVIAEAPDGQTAVEQIPEVKPDVVLLDMRMPGMTGVELLEKLHTLDCLPSYKILITGGLDEQAEVNELLDGDLQFDLVLNKPFSRRELARHLKLLFESAS